MTIVMVQINIDKQCISFSILIYDTQIIRGRVNKFYTFKSKKFQIITCQKLCELLDGWVSCNGTNSIFSKYYLVYTTINIQNLTVKLLGNELTQSSNSVQYF